MSSELHLGKSMSDKHRKMAEENLAPVLEPGEAITAIFLLNKLSPNTAMLVLTGHRIFGVGRKKVTRTAAAAGLSALTVEERTISSKLQVDAGQGLEEWGSVIENGPIREHLLQLTGLPEAIRAALAAELAAPTREEKAEARRAAFKQDRERAHEELKEEQERGKAERKEQQARDKQEREEQQAREKQEREAEEARFKEVRAKWDGLVGHLVRQDVVAELEASCREGEEPLTAIGANNTALGVMAVFADRCVIVKRGSLVGAFGGGRTATIAYTDVTGIEFNSDLGGGVLEILTPSYQGTRNNGRPGDGDVDAFELPNTVPMSKKHHEAMRPRIAQLQDLVAQAKRAASAPAVAQAAPAAAPAFDLAAEIRKIHDLHTAGVLTEEEFAAAKRALIERA
jgi:hypothetical protein